MDGGGVGEVRAGCLHWEALGWDGVGVVGMGCLVLGRVWVYGLEVGW